MKRLLTTVAAAMALAAAPAVPAHADQPTTVNPPPMVWDALNPCTELMHEVTLNPVVSFHQHRNNGLFRVGYTGSTDSGYTLTAGVEQAQKNNNVVRGTFTFQWRHEDGSQIREQGKFVVNFITDEMLVDVLSSECLGRD